MSDENGLRETKLRIAGIIISLISSEDFKVKIDASHGQFIVAAGIPDVVLRVHYGSIPSFDIKEKIFDSGGVWSLYYSYDNKIILPFCSPAFEPPLYKLAILEQDFKFGDVYIRTKKSDKGSPINPLEYPLDEVLMVNLLSLGRGIEIHACGIIDEDQGTVFCGTSGAGKSTLANMWKTKKDVVILSDDRLIIRKIENHFWVYGTPWHGDAKVSSPEGAPLGKIFFIKHAKKNTVAAIKGIDIVSRLLVRSFPTFWDSARMEYTLSVCSELSKKIPCYELGFAPNESVLDIIRSVK
jgi:hypothetical protein